MQRTSGSLSQQLAWNENIFLDISLHKGTFGGRTGTLERFRQSLHQGPAQQTSMDSP